MLLWFRNDLRVTDNPALNFAIENGVTDAIFFISPRQWQTHHLAAIKIDFIYRHALLIKHQLAQLGISLALVEADSFADQKAYLLTNQHRQLIVNKELELNEMERDEALSHAGVEFIAFESDVVVPKGQILNQSGQMFKVFTPFKRAWLSWLRQHGFGICTHENILAMQNGSISNTIEIDSGKFAAGANKWPLADQVLQSLIPAFLENKLDRYQDQRDIPSIKGTSGLSPYLAIGAISPKYLLTLLLSRHPDLLSEQSAQAFSWLNELIWREFYRHLLFHFPHLIKGNVFNEKYAAIPWQTNETYLAAWQQGKTGYPIVDAAMRQLNQTGWMHNRLRMIVASFLTKHLLVDWRAGEQYFTEKLIDLDFAANNGGWQWSAGTGCDAQPYFRIFNPMTQSEKFDPQGKFIRKYLPELADIPDKYIHFPHEYIKVTGKANYWPAIVEHKAAREKALAFYKQHL
ncbi:deoxyribodipyrimidine photo-lyase [Thalassotalea euphylliae]|uniref:Deoxyribodipyrimidine photo-lyase n=1 Tax=Thalassotalea euphylliae TaxID=1655234 RepID=A0A3E0TRA1_9GAMM|nr:FAD-binding domain-containing protein [Thalassotalea euphylliae]REL26880.1 deoxyribodipyrimidine photo-lyase [Thalassotalea euphylliae]